MTQPIKPSVRCDVYQASKRANTYVLVRAGTNVESVVPKESKDELGALSMFRSIDLNEDIPAVAVPQREALKAIETDGYYIATVKVSFEVG